MDLPPTVSIQTSFSNDWERFIHNFVQNKVYQNGEENDYKSKNVQLEQERITDFLICWPEKKKEKKQL